MTDQNDTDSQKASPLTVERLREVLLYDADTGLFTWKACIGKRIKAGQLAGALHHDGYITINIDGKKYGAHRLAWLYMHGEWPQNEIDHANLRRSDNRILNLRDATRTQNSRNGKIPKNNTSGYKGVHWCKRRKRWLAQISVNGKKPYLGHFLSPESAHAAYCEAAKKYHGEFARFK